MGRYYSMPDVVNGKRLELRAGDQRIIVDHQATGVNPPPPDQIRARFRGDQCYLLCGLKQVQMSIPVAAKIGHALANNGGAALYLGGVVLLDIGGERYSLMGEPAIQLGGVLLRKADRADDWQRENPRRVAV